MEPLELRNANTPEAEVIVGTEAPDTLIGGGGNDTLRGLGGNDSLDGGDGRDQMEGNAGDDTINASTGSVESELESFGDFVMPGLGADMIIGNAALWDAGDGVDIAYGDVSGAGGLTITVNDDGSGTVVSGTQGLVDDTFTFANFFVGSQDDDLILGSDVDRFQGFHLLGGNDTLHGGDGFDYLSYEFETSWLNGAGGPISVDMAAGTVTDTQGGTDTFTGIEQIDGSEFADTMTAAGTDGGIELHGLDGNDTLIGSAGNETLRGNMGNDLLIDRGGSDIFDGGDGLDTLRLSSVGLTDETFTVDVDLNNGTQGTSSLDADDDILISIENYEYFGVFNMNIIGSDNANLLSSDSGNDTLIGGAGDDTLSGGAGDDILIGGVGLDIVEMDIGESDATIIEENGTFIVQSILGRDHLNGIEAIVFNDGTVTLTPQGQTLIGIDGPDALTGNEGDDNIFGLGGNDTLDGAGGNDNIGAGDGDDVVFGGGGNDNMGGGLGNDIMEGGADDDFMGGGLGDDLVDGGDDNDVVNGGGGNDTLIGGAGDDTMGASVGNDTVLGGDGNDDMGGGAGRDVIDGGSGNDSIGGGEGDDTVHGGADDDFLAGGGRNDVITGGSGNDTINGGDGDDTMTGGDGADVFVFNFFKDVDADVITDFEDGVDSFFIRIENPETGAVNIDNGGNGLQGYVNAMNITDTVDGAMMTIDGHTILVENVAAADLTLNDFAFL